MTPAALTPAPGAHRSDRLQMSMRQRQATQRGTVCIIASVKAPELNGATGTCVGGVCDSDRWAVRLQVGGVNVWASPDTHPHQLRRDGGGSARCPRGAHVRVLGGLATVRRRLEFSSSLAEFRTPCEVALLGLQVLQRDRGSVVQKSVIELGRVEASRGVSLLSRDRYTLEDSRWR